MTFDDLKEELKKFPPYVQQEDKYIIDVVNELVDNYIAILREVDDVEYQSIGVKKTTVINKVKSVKKVIIDAIEYYLKGQFGEACNRIYKSFFDSKNSDRVRIAGRLETKPLLFRVRSSDSGHLYKDREMFHIPFELRGKVQNQRYSISGYPCLYLGSSIYVCWEELERPGIDTSNIVTIKNNDYLYVVNLLMPGTSDSINKNTLYRIPLVIACSLKVHNTRNSFKAEYILSQIILQCILKRNNEGGFIFRGKVRLIDGIRYLSTHYNDLQKLFDDEELFINYVIPVIDCKMEGLCSTLCDKFTISKPISPNIERIYDSSFGIASVSKHINPKDRYSSSLFGLMEEKLKSVKTYKLDPHK